MSFDFIKDRNKKIHFIGIGGISMSGLAEILLQNNYTVSGSDMKSSSLTDKLMKRGATIFIGHHEANIQGADLVVYTAAVSVDNPEYIAAQKNHIPLMDRAEFLGHIMKGHAYNVAITGTHGKTTTTSMFSHIVLKANLDPTILVGGELDIINGNVRTGNSEYFIAEACEYKASFLKFFPYIGVLLNIDVDHLDYYRDLKHIQDTFKEFIHLIPEKGFLIAHVEDENIREILSEANCNVITYGIKEGLFRAKDIQYNQKGCAFFKAYKEEQFLFSVQLNVPGKHNVLNALASIGAALSLNISPEFIVQGLESFFGTHRRFEIKGIRKEVTVIDDYAHHPTEIKATLKAAKNYPHNKIYCIFQPHTFTRTISLFEDFSHSFYDVDHLILMDIYAAREKDLNLVNSDMLGDKIRENGVSCVNIHDFAECVDYLRTQVKAGDLLLTVGAGDVYQIGEMFLED